MSAVPTWCVVCRHPAPAALCARCGSTETTTDRPEAGWGSPTVTRRHGTELYDDIAFEVLAEELEEA